MEKSSRSKGEEQDLKISLATSENLGHSKTWRMKTSGRNNKDGEEDYENEPIVSHSIQHVWLEQPIPDKLFFLATGEGCGTVEVGISSTARYYFHLLWTEGATGTV